MSRARTWLVTLLLFPPLWLPGVCGQTRDTLTVLHTSDPHVVFTLDEYHRVLAGALKGTRGNVDSLQKFFHTIPKQMRADAVVITGDILACFEGETSSNGVLGCQIEQWRSLCAQCPVPIYLTLGNHDISTYTISAGDSSIVTSQSGAERARASWIRNIPCFYDGTYYARIFQVGNARYHFVFLDDGYSLHDGSRMLDKAQLDWLNEQVERAGDEPVVLFHHVYFPIGDVNNDGVSFDRRKPVDGPNEKQCSEGFLRVLNEHRNIRALVVGHGHENVSEKIPFPSGHSVYQIETGSVTEGYVNWRLLQCTENTIIVSTPGGMKSEITIEAREKGKENVRNR